MKISPIQKFTELKNEIIFSHLTGDYKGCVKASKEYATLAIKDFNTAKNAPSMSIKNVPLFSMTGLKMMKVLLLNKLRIKTPEEKILQKMAEREKLKQKYLA